MSVLDRAALEASPLADLHAIASELGLDGFRRLRKADLSTPSSRARAATAPAGRRTMRRQTPTRTRRARRAEDADATRPSPRRSRGAPRARERGGRATRRGRGRRDASARAPQREERRRPSPRSRGARTRVAEGTVELLGNGSAFLRVNAARALRRRRLRLRRPGAPLRARLRRQRHRPGAPAAALRALPVAGPRRDDQRPPGRRGRRGHALRRAAGRLPDRALRARRRRPDPQGDRVADPVRPRLARDDRRARAGRARPRRCAASRRARRQRRLELTGRVLAGVRPEEIAGVEGGPGRARRPRSRFAASGDAQAQTVEHAVEQARRIAARGGNAVVLVDSLDALPPRPAPGAGARRATSSTAAR